MIDKKDDYIITREMMKNIIGQSIYMVAVLFVVVFAGEFFIPEDCYDQTPIDCGTTEGCFTQNYQWCRNNKYIRTGRRFSYTGEDGDETNGLYSKTVTKVLKLGVQ